MTAIVFIVHVADESCNVQGYRVVTVGHSLGAGVSALVALLLRPRYPNIFCYAYSPPGALMRSELILKTLTLIF